MFVTVELPERQEYLSEFLQVPAGNDRVAAVPETDIFFLFFF